MAACGVKDNGFDPSACARFGAALPVGCTGARGDDEQGDEDKVGGGCTPLMKTEEKAEPSDATV